MGFVPLFSSYNSKFYLISYGFLTFSILPKCNVSMLYVLCKKILYQLVESLKLELSMSSLIFLKFEKYQYFTAVTLNSLVLEGVNKLEALVFKSKVKTCIVLL